MKQWRNIIDPITNDCVGWSLYLGETQAASIHPSINDAKFNYKFTASFDCTAYCSHGLNAKTLEDAKEEVEKILLEGYLNVVDRHTKIVKEYSEFLQCLTTETN